MAAETLPDNVDLAVVQDITALIRSFPDPDERDAALAEVEAIITQLVDDITQTASVTANATLTALLPEFLRNVKTWPYATGRQELKAKIKWAVATVRNLLREALAEMGGCIGLLQMAPG